MILRFLFVGPTPGHFPISGFSSTEGFESRSCCTCTSNECFPVDGGGYPERVPAPASNALRGAGCWQPKRRLPPAATTNRLRSLQSAPPSMLLHIMQRKNSTRYKHNVANPHIFCVYLHPPSNPHLVHFLYRFRLHVALSYVGPQNELTFVGSIS